MASQLIYRTFVKGQPWEHSVMVSIKEGQNAEADLLRQIIQGPRIRRSGRETTTRATVSWSRTNVMQEPHTLLQQGVGSRLSSSRMEVRDARDWFASKTL